MSAKNIKNFVIISHIDHGKSTLADRFLELTGSIEKKDMRAQYLDSMDLERERGITIKMKPVKMQWKGFDLNLIDTPGHIDFNYEVSRSLAAVEGAILLVDATKGVQAQTISNLDLALKEKLTIIPAVNKIDMPAARVDEVKKEISDILKISKDEIFSISAKTGENVEKLLDEVVKRVPSPKDLDSKPARSLIFDSKYDSFLGVVAYVRIVEGVIKKQEKIKLVNSKDNGLVKEIGIFKPQMQKGEELRSGQIGFIATGIKEPEKIKIGDTITLSKYDRVQPLFGYQDSKPKIFVSLCPNQQSDYELLKTALSKLKLNDSALFFTPLNYHVLGRGFLCGFLGSLHAEITIERLKREFGLELVISSAQVSYKVVVKEEEEMVYNPAQWPQNPKKSLEPWVEIKLLVPSQYLGNVFDLLQSMGGEHIESNPFGDGRYIIIYHMPLREVIGSFFEELLNITQGFASLTYKEIGYKESDLVKMEVLIAQKTEEAFSRIVPKDKAYSEAKKIVSKIKEALPAQLFTVAIQARVGGKIIARETISARRKDVTGYLYGGDYSRKRKLLEKQKKGKEKLKQKGEVHIPPSVFIKIFNS